MPGARVGPLGRLWFRQLDQYPRTGMRVLSLGIVVSSMTPIVDYGTQVAADSAKYAPEVATAQAVDPTTLHELTVNPHNVAAGLKAVGEVSAKFHISSSAAIGRLTALQRASSQPGFKFLEAHGPAIAEAAKVTPGQWQTWWWVCVDGEAAFVPLIFLMTGRWRPKRARQDAQLHDLAVRQELEKLNQSA